MKLKLSLILTIICAVLIAACTSHKGELKTAIKAELNTVNKTMNAGKLDNAAINKADSLMLAYVSNFPKDTISPDFMLKTAQLLQMQRNYSDANKLLDKLVNDYPNSKAAPDALYFNGFIFENYEYDLAKAKTRYELFLNKYPDNELAKSVKSSLKNLGKSPEDILKESNQADTAKIPS